ncbi:M60 family metallopeptidase [Acutalibacter caecimuris]|uniref:M60 family metallopeptidase n=1 Tax=Acutalibacter caecimuris TaxID=3093657 RepID=UPI002AC9AEFA|nr:M60 family metallopeptidase [Acutalibacter sp. M00118]
MKISTRILSGLLSVLLTLTLLLPAAPAASAAPEDSTPPRGSLTAALRLDYPQPLEALQAHEVTAALYQNGEPLGEVPLWQPGEAQMGSYAATLAAKDADGGETTGDWPKYLELAVSGLPQGSYDLVFSGLGYQGFVQPLTIEDCDLYVALGTGDGTFALGDLNADSQIDAEDRELMSQHLASTEEADLAMYDLNGDGKIDIVDLGYVNDNLGLTGEAFMAEGAMLAPPVDPEGISQDLAAAGTTVTEGELASLFTAGGQGATLAGPGTELALPIPFSQPVELRQVAITSPELGGVETGSVTVEYEDGTTEELPIDAAIPAGVYAISRTPGTRTITIDLGQRVPVKKITVRVEKTEDGTVSVESVQFLKDIIPENPAAVNRLVNGLAAEAGSGEVTLRWRELPNVTGYRVAYWLDGNQGAAKTLEVDRPFATVTGLENLKTYWFQVTPIAQGWEGSPCEAVSATPQPAQKPDAPDMVSIGELDGALTVSWKASKGATYYEVYYKKKDAAGQYQQAGGMIKGTSTRISGLVNGTTYSVYVVAGNEIGSSGPSRISEGTPKAVDYDTPQGLPTASLLGPDKIKDIRLAWPNNYAAGEYTADAPFTPQNLIDGDYRTHWTAANWHGNEHVITTFTEPVDLQAVLWAPRLDGNYPSWLRAYSIQVWYEGDDLSQNGRLIVPDPRRGGVDNNTDTGNNGGYVQTWPNIPNRGLIPTTKFAVLPLGPAKKVVQISVAVEQAGYNLVSCSELMFMKYDPAHCLPDEIAALFADDLRTTLRPGVDAAQIDALKARLDSDEKYYYLDTATLADELALARELLGGSSAGVIKEGVQSRSAGADSQKYSQGGSDLQPLGVTALANKEITLYAQGIPEGGTLTVYASQFNAEASAWRSSMGTVENGRNTLLVPKIGSQNTQRGGSLYFTYTGPNPEKVRLHIRRATAIPVLELSGWYDMTETARRNTITQYLGDLDAYLATAGVNENNKTTNVLNVTEISTPTMLLSLPALAVKNSTAATGDARVEALFNSVLAWEDLMHICKTTQGIDNTYHDNDMQSRQNIRCMQMFSGAFMYAAGNHIGIGYGSCGGMAGGRPISQLAAGATANQLFGWGIAHEIGHNMDKLGRAEITNNIYSLMVQTWDGKNGTLPSRLETSGKYAKAFTKTAQGLPGESNDVFVQLAMYWQLHLAYDGAAPADFYNRFFKAWKAGTYTTGFSSLSYDEKMALTAAGVAGKNLTEFFTRWGMRLSQPVKDKLASYPAEPRALWYLSDQSRRERLAGTGAGSVNHLLSAKLKAGSVNQVEISAATREAVNIQGYEILRDGKPIAFVTPDQVQGSLLYTDEIGSGNHLAFTYSVKTYDLLGNLIDTTGGMQVRVAYDKTVPASQYDLSLSGTTAVFTLKGETAVSGLKLLNTLPGSGSFEVSVTDMGGKKIVARSGSYGDSQSADDPQSYVTYFNKPGTNSASGTIWTYDAKTVTITGLPAGISKDNIQLISYAGDDISFLTGEGGFVGRLFADYDCGGGNVLKAGTLVIAGTYRGDPYYSSIRVKGKFTATKTVVDDRGEETVETTEEIRDIDGDCYLFSQVPEDKKVSDISDGLFLFVPNVQREAELQDATHCDGVNLLPSEVMAELYRVDDPNDPDSPRLTTASTLWALSPGGEDLPEIVLNEN